MKAKSVVLSSIILSTAILTLAACSSSGPSAVQRGTAGEEVSSLCFARQVDSWQPLSRDSILLKKGVNDYYRVQLAGVCDPQRAGLRLVTQARSGICLGSGDQIDFEGDFATSCTITQINAWTPAPE